VEYSDVNGVMANPRRTVFEDMQDINGYPYPTFPVDWNQIRIVSMDNFTYTVKAVTEQWFVLGENVFAFKSCQCGESNVCGEQSIKCLCYRYRLLPDPCPVVCSIGCSNKTPAFTASILNGVKAFMTYVERRAVVLSKTCRAGAQAILLGAH
jgi:hypothetical protein